MSESFTKSRLDPTNDMNTRRTGSPNPYTTYYAPPPEIVSRKIIHRGGWTYIDSNPLYYDSLVKRFKRTGYIFLVIEMILSLTIFLPVKYVLFRQIFFVFSQLSDENGTGNIESNNQGSPFLSYKNYNPYLVATTPPPLPPNHIDHISSTLSPSFNPAIYSIIALIEIIHFLSTFFAISALYEESKKKSIIFSLFSVLSFFLTALLTGFFLLAMPTIFNQKLIHVHEGIEYKLTTFESWSEWTLIVWTLIVTFILFTFFLYFSTLVSFKTNLVEREEETANRLIQNSYPSTSNISIKSFDQKSDRNRNNNNEEGINWKMFSLDPPEVQKEKERAMKEKAGTGINYLDVHSSRPNSPVSQRREL